ncbi:putative pilin/flagellin [Halapricum desulfuricans]|uniref:Putative pilin/flagellin n=1 Tax=Halapricum desulfuricans TaxID=2841257 RepID=A0A897MX93_9EURY|nr:putative pilin/flagellin [Halapricum desulfuricans]
MSSCSRCDRGQTEPIAALFAVVLVAIAITTYGGVLVELLPGQSDRAPTVATEERVWDELGGDGVYDAGTLSDPSSAIDHSVLPRGFSVSVDVTYRTDDGRKSDGRVVYTPDGNTDEYGSGEIPERADVITRPIPVRIAPGVVESGRLSVAVWKR